MATEKSKFTLRTETEVLKKFRVIADYNGRSVNREIEFLMKKHIAEFEKTNDKTAFN